MQKICLLLVLLFSIISAPAAVLSGNFAPSIESRVVDLSTEGTLDWSHWGYISPNEFDHKAGTIPLIGDVTVLGTNPAQRFADGLIGFTWSDGTPEAAAEATPTGIFARGLTGGFQLSVAADTTLRRLKVYTGVRFGQGRLQAVLSDSSAPAYTSTALDSALDSDGVYTLLYSAGSAGQFLTVTLTPELFYDEVNGSVRLQAAVLATDLPPSVSITNPASNTVFPYLAPILIEAEAADPDGAISKLEFFAGTLKLGESIAAPYSFLWNNAPTGAYALTVRATDNDGAVAVSEPVAITILTNRPPSVALVTPVTESNFLLSETIAITAEASDPDGTIVKIELFDGLTKLAESTAGGGLFSFLLTNASLGTHVLTARATDNAGLTEKSSPATVFVYQSGGTLEVSVAKPSTSINLSSEGTTDWAHWGLVTQSSFNHKNGVAQQIGNYSLIGHSPAYPYADNYNSYTWTDGTPVQAVTDTTTGVYSFGEDNGFEVQVVADATVRTLKLYVGAFGAQGKLQAYLSDFSAPVLFDTTVTNADNGLGGVYTIQFQAATPGQSLVVRFTGLALYLPDGNVTLQAATLVSDNAPPTASIVSPTNGTVFHAPANIDIQASASDSDGSITAIEIFRSGVKLGDAVGIPPVFHWTNVAAGIYSLQVRSTDDLGATFISSPIQVAVIRGGGTLSGKIALPPAAVNLTAEGTLDWGHWGLLSRNSFNHKRFVMQLITADLGSGQSQRYANNRSSFFWTNGTPTLSAAGTTTGIFRDGPNSGFQFVVPAERTLRQLKVYVGLYGARGKFEAILSDLSAAPYTDASLMSVYGTVVGVYTCNYAAASSGQSLTIRYTADELFDADYGNVTWQAATLGAIGPAHLLGPARSDSGASIAFLTQPDVNYTVQYTDSLELPNWLTLTNLPGMNGPATIIDPQPAWPSRFYRLKLQ